VGCLLLCWISLASLLAAGLVGQLPLSDPPVLNHLLALALLVGLWAPPLAGGLWLARRPGWAGLRPLGLALILAGGYGLAAITVPAIAGDNNTLEAVLRLGGLTLLALAAGRWMLSASGVPRPLLAGVLGLGAPPLAGLALAGGLIALLTLGWPLTGALGDSRASLGLLLLTLAVVLPEEIVFRGAILGLLTHRHPRRTTLAAAVSLLIYLAFIPTQVLPSGDWDALLWLLALPPLALLATELRALTGSLWAGVVVCWFLRAMPQLFTDPRDELLEPTQWLAWGWTLLAAVVITVVSWTARRVIAHRWPLSRVARLALTVSLALLIWAGWSGAWVVAGKPGFHNDGFIILMKEQADLSGAAQIDDPVARRAFVYQALVDTADGSQAPIRARLEAEGLAYRRYYLQNVIRVDGHRWRTRDFADLTGVAGVVPNPNVRPYPIHTAVGILPDVQGEGGEGNGIEWNIRQIGADAVWDMGFRGQGIVIGGQDTGYDWQHPALKQSYRGWDPAASHADHHYNWHDAWDDEPVPHDEDGHGTHTMGTMVGDDEQGNRIGVAPEARWIGCRNMRRGIGNPTSYLECMEFFLAPYPPGGDPFHDGEVSLSPDVVNNSWGCPDYEGCQQETLKPAMEALRAAGMMMVVSAGNDGPGCQTASEPPARYDAVFSVGATNRIGEIAFFSSRGPVVDMDAGQLLKPDIAAPGVDIRSSVPGGDYGISMGTSMAGPHVAGVVALLWSAWPELRGNVEATEGILRRSATAGPVSQVCSPSAQTSAPGGLIEEILAAAGGDSPVCACGGVTGTPNNVYGWGQVNALQAVESVHKD